MKIRAINYINWIYVLIISFTIAGCGGGGGGNDGSLGTRVPNSTVGGCFLEDYPDPANSEYILPYQVGESYEVNQGNCGQFITHRPVCTGIDINGAVVNCGDGRYSYDFAMPIGVVILATRGGTVSLIKDGFPNSSNSIDENNFVSILHDDGTVSSYLHLSPNSIMVSVGDVVQQGDPIALSGSSGFTDPGFSNPHLHFSVITPPFDFCTATVSSGCVTIPVTFRNAQPLDAPLLEDRVYEALPF